MPVITLPPNDPLTSSAEKSPKGCVSTKHPDFAAMLPRWTTIRDTISGEHAIKSGGVKYLPQPNKTDTSKENQDRYESYVERAVFYASTQRTLLGLVGQVFALDPVVELPESLKLLIEDIDGDGVTLNSALEQTTAAVVAYGRAGVLTDYPKLEKPMTVEERDKGEIRPNIVYYSPFNIINWRTRKVGTVMKKSLIVLAETHQEDNDGFESKTLDQWRVLKLDSLNEYQIELYRRKTDENGDNDLEAPIELAETYKPLDYLGKPFTEIPFEFIGSLNNNQYPDNPPLEGIATLNIAHYRNSADYEESCFIVGQPTVWVSGLDKKWIDEVFKDKTMKIGSRDVIPLPANGQAGIIQAQENSMPLEAMRLKEKQMTAIGAKLVEPAQVQRTLGEARLEEATSSSILVTCVKNVQKAFKRAFESAEKFHGKAGDINITISTDFAISRLDPNERQVLFSEWVGGGITTKEYRTQLRKAGIAEDPDDSPEIKRPETPPASQPKPKE